MPYTAFIFYNLVLALSKGMDTNAATNPAMALELKTLIKQ